MGTAATWPPSPGARRGAAFPRPVLAADEADHSAADADEANPGNCGEADGERVRVRTGDEDYQGHAKQVKQVREGEISPGPQVRLLDEPTLGLDPLGARELRLFLRDDVIRGGGCTAVVGTGRGIMAGPQ